MASDGTPGNPAEFVRLVTTNVVGTFNVMSQVALYLNPRRLGRPEEFAAFAAHIIENEFFNAATPRFDAGYRIPLSL